MTRDSTRSVHGSEHNDETTGSVTTPIYQTSTFGYAKAEQLSRAVTGKAPGFVYSRWDNPTVSVLEEKLADLEEAEAAAFFSSGMAAISTSVMAQLEGGDRVLGIRDLYGETYRLIHDVLPRFGVGSDLVDPTDASEFRRAAGKRTRLVYIETPTNPTLKLVDIAAVAKIAHAAGALLLVDNTFASPLCQKPLELGADIVLHSATKYLGGHSDVIAGGVAGDRRLVDTIKSMRRTLGGTLDPHAAFLVLRGIKTLAVRLEKQGNNAMSLAEFLEAQRGVKRVIYPGLKSHPQHDLARRQMTGFGAMLSFEVDGSGRDAMEFMESLRYGTMGASLGAVETLVSHPATLSHTQLSPEERERTGISDALIRVSVGIEDAEDLISDFGNALARLKGRGRQSTRPRAAQGPRGPPRRT